MRCDAKGVYLRPERRDSAIHQAVAGDGIHPFKKMADHGHQIVSAAGFAGPGVMRMLCGQVIHVNVLRRQLTAQQLFDPGLQCGRVSVCQTGPSSPGNFARCEFELSPFRVIF